MPSSCAGGSSCREFFWLRSELRRWKGKILPFWHVSNSFTCESQGEVLFFPANSLEVTSCSRPQVWPHLDQHPHGKLAASRGQLHSHQQETGPVCWRSFGIIHQTGNFREAKCCKWRQNSCRLLTLGSGKFGRGFLIVTFVIFLLQTLVLAPGLPA